MFNFIKSGISDGMTKLLQSKLKNVPQAEQDKMIRMIEKNPDLFMKIAKEVQELMKSGKSETDAGIEVMKKYQTELQKLA